MLVSFTIYDKFSGFTSFYLDVIVYLALLLAVLIIITKNPIVSVLCLIFVFTEISAYLILIGLKFLGISYLLVYVGAVSILFLFILMLINIRVSELANDTNNYIPLAMLTILIFYISLDNVLPNKKHALYGEESTLYDALFYTNELKYVSSNSWDTCIVNSSDITSVGNLMYTNYSIWLIITSIILLLAMVGSIVITIKQKY